MKPIVALCVLLPFTTVAYAATTTDKDKPTTIIDVGEGSPLVQAAVTGDRAALTEAASVPLPGMEAITKALLARLDGDFEASGKIARGCVDEAVRGTVNAQVGVPCAQIAASDLFMRGDLRGWARMTHADWAKLRAPMEKEVGHGGITTAPVLAAEEVIKGMGKAPTTFAVTKRMDKLDFLPATERSTAPGAQLIVPAKVNGKTLNMRLDTGSQMTVLSRADADRLGLKVLNVNLGIDGQAATSNGGKSGMVNIAQLQVGNLDVHETSVLVVDFSESVLGIDLIGRMADRVAISKTGMRFDAKVTNDCPSPPDYLLDFSGVYQHRFAIQATIDGKDTPVMLVTGDDGYMTLSSDDPSLRTSDAHGLMRTDTVNGPVMRKFYAGKARLESGARKVDLETTIFPADGSPIPHMLGSGVLNDFDILLDNKRHRACLLPPTKPV
ncbi:MAG: hypothetical protein GAK28_01829 [Luteibacter sp.]|uniref:retropepsin-like aspartic protease n=1 Tax=Luteibacter sp. TaxID=1886636 RepID=UPI001384AB10|nr:retropepsin-like aspartic protease [Luteibacter sp.]KAF1007487.1 MAG: hypothetical protein GAK28_01829 [Luteibacter sp.]